MSALHSRQQTDRLTPRQRAAEYHAAGFSWEKSCELADFDERVEVEATLGAWLLIFFGLVVLIFVGLYAADTMASAFRVVS